MRVRTLSLGFVFALAGMSIDAGAASDRPTRSGTRASGATSAAKRFATRPARREVLASVPSSPDDPQKGQAQQAAERDRLAERIAALKRQIADGEKSRSGAAAALARAERALADVERRIAELAQRQKTAQELVATLDRQRTGTARQIASGEAALGTTIGQWSANIGRDPVTAFLVGGDPNVPHRTDFYLRRIVQAEASDVEALRGRAADLQARREHADDEHRALVAQAEAEKAAHESLANDRAAQRQALSELSQRLAAQRSTASALEADERRLTQVVQRLQREVERRAAEERARRELARQKAEQAAAAATRRPRRADAGTTPKADVPPARVEAPVDEGSGTGAFARLRGQLRWPVRGTVAGRYGAPRGSGGGTWKGVFVRSDAGAEVHAVAAGQVIFSDELRGFGNLVIVDHGDQYLSIYGNNDALVRRTGDRVAAGDVVARAGNSSGDEQTGLYFELRFRGRPFDPLPWIGGR